MQSEPVPPSVLPDIQHILQATKITSLTTQYNSVKLLKTTPTRNSVTPFTTMRKDDTVQLTSLFETHEKEYGLIQSNAV